MTEARVEVMAYAGYRGEESPRAFVLQDHRIEVKKVLDQWTGENAATGERRRCFKVKGSDFRTHTLCYDEGEMAWFYLK